MQSMKDLARILRRQATKSEQLLSGCLRKNRLRGFSFRRQQIIGPYITDFCCFDGKLVIEIDGGSHDHPARLEKDLIRQNYLEKAGFGVLRFTDEEVEENLQAVVLKIENFLENYPPP